MDANELKQKDEAALKSLLLEKRKEAFSLRMQRGSGQEVRTHQFREVRRDIARIKTVMNQIRQAK
jgi:large subunit ribosomal protein L29